jgi:hypothetical protein
VVATTHTLLYKTRRNRIVSHELAHAFETAMSDAGIATKSIELHTGVESSDMYMYCELARSGEVSDAEMRALQRALAAQSGCVDGGATLDRLQRVFAMRGASRGAFRSFHYVVETDPADGWQDELFRWYDEEHMPGLAAVPGCVFAERYVNHDRGPYSLACYGLVDADVTKSPAWLAVRETEWSARVRPQFRNTKRTMFCVIASTCGDV